MEIEVAIPSPIPTTFTYHSETGVSRGSRVLVPFGSRTVVGVSLGEKEAAEEKAGRYELKNIEEVIDGEPVYSEVCLKIAHWLSNYDMHPIGEVFRTMLPAGMSTTRKYSVELTKKGAAALGDSASEVGQLLGFIYNKKQTLTVATATNKIKKWSKEAPREVVWSMSRLIEEGLVRKHSGTQIGVRRFDGLGDKPEPIDLSKVEALAMELRGCQLDAFNLISKQINAATEVMKPFLLRGVTGSGKTEIYLQLIAEAIKRSEQERGIPAQSLVLVPEISLTPQMTEIFKKRFLGRVAVVHSAMTDRDRWEELQRVSSGDAIILIGPRSAVFAPFANLKLIVVDEEHDSSYKQNSGLMYHGRDVAVLRGRLENASVILGSATPSLESYYNAKQEKYTMIELTERVGGRPLPEIEIIPIKPSFSLAQIVSSSANSTSSEGHQVPIEPQVIEELSQNQSKGMQSIVLVNRRGFAYYLFSLKEKRAVTCPQCSISLTLHRGNTRLRCHYCDYSTSTQSILSAHPDDQFAAVGYGSEKVEHFLKEQIPKAVIVRLDSDITAKKDILPQTLEKFRNQDIDILVGTQMLAKGHDFPKVTMTAILDVDQLLELPDFRAGERTFQLIVQAAGRAGRSDHRGRVLIQSARLSHPVVQAAIKQDYIGFADRELELRSSCFYPPFSRMILVEFNSMNISVLNQLCDRIDDWFDSIGHRYPEWPKKVKVLGPATPAVEMIRNRWRKVMVFSSQDTGTLREVVSYFATAFKKQKGDLRMRIDVDPQSLI